VKQRDETFGGYSKPSKPACLAYGLPPSACPTGSKLREVEGSVCAKCYACRGHYARPGVQHALDRRLYHVRRALRWPRIRAEFVEAFAAGLLRQLALTRRQLARTGKPGKVDGRYFRWHDAGDLQSTAHLRLICEIARQTPEVRHKLPTKEFATVRDYLLTGGVIPYNLAVLLSISMIDGEPPLNFRNLRKLSDQVGIAACHSKHDPLPDFFACPATEPGATHTCEGCRKCWEPGITVSYRRH
jgi:hypothetical protein